MTTPSSLPTLKKFLEIVLPGQSQAVHQVRQELIEFAYDPLAKTLLLEGPIGTGKSTLARAVGMLKRVAPLNDRFATSILGSLKYETPGRVEAKLMPWYVELTLTGLVENLADAQLFGATRGAYTGAVDRPGVFELAMTGRMSEGREPSGARLTGGVVFLDEIGELADHDLLQAKLLPVLSGGLFYRLGGEGKEEYQRTYQGIAIFASWRMLDNVLRADLLSRISANRIRLPSLADRMEDFEFILDELETFIGNGARNEIEKIMIADAEADKGYWQARKNSITCLDSKSRKLLSQVDWSVCGNMRGLTVAIEQIVAGGRQAPEVIEKLSVLKSPDQERGRMPDLVDRLLRRRPDRRGLAAHVKDLEVEQRRELAERLLSDVDLRRQVAVALGIDEATIAYQVRQLPRRRTGGGSEGDSK